ncbi:MAG TPA: sigma-70 family RNA polymerase sigma factor [Pyrinomonadaceae bacterium]|jgi:RNA polymerase sigma-70 factor (ECF subfamily)
MLLKNQKSEEISQAEIVRREDLLRATFKRDGRKLMMAILAFTQNRAAAEDVFQETFLQAVKRAERYNPADSALPWLKQVAFNIVRHKRRKESTERKYILPAAEAAPDFSLDDDLSEVALFDLLSKNAAIAEERAAERAESVIAVLTREEREMLEMRFVDRLSGEQTAARFGISRESLDMRVYRAKNKLRKALFSDANK